MNRSRTQCPAAAAIALALLLAPAPGSGSTSEGSDRQISHSPGQLRHALAASLIPAELDQLRIPFEADNQVRRAALRATRGSVSDREKLAGIQSFFRQQGFRERYVPGLTQTAAETLESGQGDCHSFASLFVAMARSVGLNAFYLDASDIENDFSRQGRDLVETGHILAGVRLGPEILAIDFDGRTRSPKRYRVMTDREALADFYNNIGYLLAWEHRLAGGMGSEAARQAFDLATRISPRFSRAWNNLGVAHSRQGNQTRAERAYRKAIRADPNFAPAWANLGHLLNRSGRADQALSAFERAVGLQPNNAHFRLFLARTLIQVGQFSKAGLHLAEALSLDENLYQIHLLCAQVHLALGRHDAALQSAQRVLQLVPGQRDATQLVRRLGATGGKVDALL